ncbi:MAG: 23S rRNA (pseudouridine(1915)-N(3))-methyltransferase RlmH [Acholeplasmatales bacterium]|jgi:23S rRNA (pseudouridine1915-N3)-methyltransferase|nr:23S rRNA (pseudouridine(1915)-N(3))-methyltransferase RlmH [Acholeplasmatales bacterium]
MKSIKILAVGKVTREYKSDINHYLKQLNNTVIVEINEENDKEKEGMLLLNQIKEKDYVITLEIGGVTMDSVEFSKKIMLLYSSNEIVFVIGGSDGLSLNVKQRSNLEISLSKLTFPHQMARLVLVEQLYRSFMINKNHPYHK